MIEINITQEQIEELKNDKRATIKNPNGIAEIYLSITTRVPLTKVSITPGEINIRLGITYKDVMMLEETGLYVGDGFELKLKK